MLSPIGNVLGALLFSATSSMAFAANICPMEKTLEFCVAGAADVARLRSLAQNAGWKIDGTHDNFGEPLPRSGSFIVFTPEGLRFTVIYQEYASFSTVTCNFETLPSMQESKSYTGCSVDEAKRFETEFRAVWSGKVSRLQGDLGYAFMAEDGASWMRAVVSPGGSFEMTNIWIDSYSLKK